MALPLGKVVRYDITIYHTVPQVLKLVVHLSCFIKNMLKSSSFQIVESRWSIRERCESHSSKNNPGTRTPPEWGRSRGHYF